MITLYTPATGFPDLETKIAYGLARVGIESFGMDKVCVINKAGFYEVNINVDIGLFGKFENTFNLICQRLLSSPYIPFKTPGITG
ncbi:MAG: hypothetical protein N2511_07960, partial [Thermodesulfovibrionales bacterium]|nr:hypothetical protein [Thermodesulfovibrionales bacterium]